MSIPAPLSGTQALESGKKAGILIDTLETVIRGKRGFLEKFVVVLVSGGHVLIEDLPGLGKTTVAKTLSRALGGKKRGAASFRRIQFTPDLLPYDITGVDVFDPEKNIFVFQPGPVFANIVLADEINRTTPKVQSAMLEAMAERQVTVGDRTHALEDLFFIVATQNPIESEGTYPLPHAQLDRFLMKLSLGYPDREDELAILRDEPSERALPLLEPVMSVMELLGLRDTAKSVYLDGKLERAIVSLSRRLRDRPDILLGPSPRASLALARAARAQALLRGRAFVTEQDVIDLAPDVLSHRIISKDMKADMRTVTAEEARAACKENL